MKLSRLINKSRRQMADTQGFTLIEAMISLAVFSIGILGMAAMQTTAIRNNTLAITVTENTVTAMSTIEGLMVADFTGDKRLKEGTDYYTTPDGKNVITDVLTDQAIPGAKRVVVTSQFMQNGRPQTITLKIFKPRIIE